MEKQSRSQPRVPDVWVLYPVMVALLVGPLIVLFAPKSVAERLGLLAEYGTGLLLFLAYVFAMSVLACCVSRPVVYPYRWLVWMAVIVMLLNLGAYNFFVSSDIMMSAVTSAVTLLLLSNPIVVNKLGIIFRPAASRPKVPVEVIRGGASRGVDDPWLDGPGKTGRST
jgi:hypothetical protein